MTSEEQRLVEYYKNANLEEEQVDLILATGQFAASARRWRRIAVFASLGLVLTVLLTGWLFVRGERFRAQLTEDQTPAPMPAPTQESPRSPSPLSPERKPSSYRLVAFRSHDDRCPYCRATGKLYANLQNRIPKDTLEFEQFELQKTDQLADTMSRIEAEELSALVERRKETAFLVLLSPHGRPLKRFDSSEDVDQVQHLIREIIDQ